MKIIVGLGNPETKYDDTRHNVGFAMLDAYQQTTQACAFLPQSKFKADIATVTVANEKVLLVKPQTYYNLVGEAARTIMDYYQCTPADVLIIHDDLALPLGTIRTRIGGSDGGNNGLKSMNQYIGAEQTTRIRIGVWTNEHHGADKVGVVLGKFNASERALLADETPKVIELITAFITGTLETTTHRL